MKKRYEIILAAGLILTILMSNTIGFIRDGRRLEQLRGRVLRLHILADSDSERDQQLKLKVRDALLTSGILDGADDLEAAEELASAKLPDIERIAEETLRSNGCEAPVTAELADVDFDERTYGDITMPAGRYRALRVKIGSAQGHNWWCVLYPAVCVPAAEGNICDGLNDTEKDIVTDSDRYIIRFRVVELFTSLYSFFFH